MNYTVEREDNRVKITQSAISRPVNFVFFALMLGLMMWTAIKGSIERSPLILFSYMSLILSILNVFNRTRSVIDFQNQGIITTERGLTNRSHTIHRFEDLDSKYLMIKSKSFLGIRFSSIYVEFANGGRLFLVRGIFGDRKREEQLVAELNESIVKSLQSASAETAQIPKIT